MYNTSVLKSVDPSEAVFIYVALDRKKDSESNSGKIAFRQLIKDTDSDVDLRILLTRCREHTDKVFRIYRTVNARSYEKAYRIFKHIIVDDLDPTRVESEWKSCLLSPRAKYHKRFLIDVEERNNEPHDRLVEMDIPILEMTYTPRGYHMVTSPFDVRDFKYDYVEIKTDAMIYVGMFKGGEFDGYIN